jgi:hypothetical protein
MARTNGTDNSLLQAALIGYQHQLASVTAKIADIKERLGVSGRKSAAAPSTADPKPRKHRISAAGRERIAAAQRKRWAKAKKAAA